MPSTSDLDGQKDQRAKLIENVIGALGPGALADPNLPDVVARLVDQRMAARRLLDERFRAVRGRRGQPAGAQPTGGQRSRLPTEGWRT